MNQERLNTIEKEITSIRTSMKRWRFATFALLLGTGMLAADSIGPTVLDHLIVNRIDVLGSNGSPVVSIAQSKDGGKVDLYNQKGINLLRVSSTSSGGDVAVWDNAGTNVAGIWATQSGGTFSLWNEKGEELSQFASGALTLSGPEASLHIENELGTPVAVVASDPEGHGRFQIADNGGAVVSEMMMIKGFGGGVMVSTADSKRMGLLAATKEGGKLNLFNSRNVPVVVASTIQDNDGGAMVISNQRGIPVVRLTSDEDHDGLIQITDEDGKGIRKMRPLKGYSP